MFNTNCCWYVFCAKALDTNIKISHNNPTPAIQHIVRELKRMNILRWISNKRYTVTIQHLLDYSSCVQHTAHEEKKRLNSCRGESLWQMCPIWIYSTNWVDYLCYSCISIDFDAYFSMWTLFSVDQINEVKLHNTLFLFIVR